MGIHIGIIYLEEGIVSHHPGQFLEKARSGRVIYGSSAEKTGGKRKVGLTRAQRLGSGNYKSPGIYLLLRGLNREWVIKPFKYHLLFAFYSDTFSLLLRLLWPWLVDSGSRLSQIVARDNGSSGWRVFKLIEQVITGC